MFPFSQSRGGGAAVAVVGPWSATDKGADLSLTNTNRTVTKSGSDGTGSLIRGTQGLILGSGAKRQFEITFNVIGGSKASQAGIASSSLDINSTNFAGASNNAAAILATGELYFGGSLQGNVGSIGQGEAVAFVLDPAAGAFGVYRSGVLKASASIGTSGTWFPLGRGFDLNDALTLNTGGTAFAAPQSGTVAWGSP